MTIPFLSLFKKAKSRLFPASAPPAPARARGVAAAKPSSERLSKTVMPHTVRSLAPQDPFQSAASPSRAGLSASSAGSRGRDLPAAVVFALEPEMERAISLQLSDILDQLPGGYTKSGGTFDANQPILLKASEIEKGMASGKPTVALTSIYEQVPEIFLHRVSATDVTQVPLPYSKVLEQFESMHVRTDQLRDQDVPQLETPILQVAIEDTARFGTAMEPLQTSALPPVKIELATAKTLATAEPEAVARETVAPTASPGRGVPLTARGTPPTRIPFDLPPNGTGVPASERVPASSGPPVPTSLPKVPTPARIPFKISPPCADLRPKFTLVPGVEPKEDLAPATKSSAEKKDEVMIALRLQAVMQNVPAFQLSGSPVSIPEDVRIEFPFSSIEPQLATGRVAVAPKSFQAAIPESYRQLFVIDPTETAVLLPLEEVLKNLPTAALQMRQDQEEMEAIDFVQTPFSIKAEEDAKRFHGGSTTAVPKAAEVPATESAEPAVVEIESTSIEQAEASSKPAEKIDVEGEGKNEAKEVVARASALPGVAACSVTFADGLSLAGNLPAEVAADGLCAMAPSLLQRIDRHMLDTKLGPLISVTLHCAKSAVTFFMKGNICLTVLHAVAELESKSQNKLAEMANELSRTYSQPETAHVDH
jgi:predicted regulator of Ras-like GTPase activity (Roadblock/LC7/MglB family)